MATSSTHTKNIIQMSKNSPDQQERTETLRNEATRQRWDWFHRAITHAKESNESALQSADGKDEPKPVSFESLAS